MKPLPHSPKAEPTIPLPPPIPVRDYRPNALPTASQMDMEHFQNFGGGVNPLAYKGYTFSTQSRFNFRPSPTRANHKSPSRTPIKSPVTSPCPIFEIGEADELHTDSIIPHHPYSMPNTFVVEHGISPCCQLIGPITPLFPPLSLLHLGCTTLLPYPLYLIWRLLLPIFSLVTLVITIFNKTHPIRFFPLVTLSYSFLATLTIAIRAWVYYYNRQNTRLVTTPKKSYSSDLLLFQGSPHLCLMLGLALLFTSIYGSSETVSETAAFVKSANGILIFVLTALHVVDIIFTPIAFRLFNILPIFLFSIFLTVLSVRNTSTKTLFIIGSIMGASSIVVGFVVLMYGRAIFLSLHQRRLSAIGDNVHVQHTHEPI